MKLVFATKNRGKLAEAAAILECEVTGGDALPEVDETEPTFEGNALLKAISAFAATGLPSLADDSGLEVDALGGRPGVKSARYGGPGLDDAGRRKKLLEEMRGKKDRTARFVCAIAYVAEGVEKVTRATCEGVLLEEERGTGGFGYDPLFVPEGHTQSFGELSAEIKNRLSHRAKALAIAKTWL